MSTGREAPWLALILAGMGLLGLAFSGLWAYMTATATPLHPKSQDVPSMPHSAPSPKWVKAVEQGRQIVRTSLTERNLPGLSVAVGIGQEIVWAEGFGFADLDKRIPVAPNHRFRIGTASTVLTSAAAGLLLEQGRLKLDEPIQTYVPAFPKKKWPVTLRQVMGHMAGLENDGGDESSLYSQHCERPVEALQHFAESPLEFKPGTDYGYSRYGWIVVSAAIEAVVEKPFLAFVREKIFDPLGMHGTMPESATNPIPDRATFYFPRFAADPTYGPHLMRDLDYSCYAGSGVFLSTPSDLVRFGMAINGGKLLQPATVELLQTPQRLASGKETGYGLGWDLETVTLAGTKTRSAGHEGDALGGSVSALLTFPNEGIVVSVISNISYADAFAVAVKLAQAFAEQGRASPPETP